jgi:hypothetical protein
MIDIRLHASRVRDTTRSLPMSPTTVLWARKKQEAGLESVHTALLHTLNSETGAMDIERARAGEAERDEIGSFVGNTGAPALAVACH